MIYLAPNLTDIVYSVVRHVNVALRSFHTFHEFKADPTLPRDHVSEHERVPGQTWHDEIHVDVRWAWLALPIVLLALVMVLLVATICLSQIKKVGIWKDSSLALLLFSLQNEQDKATMRFAQTEGDIQEAVKGMRARLSKGVDEGDDGWKGTILIEQVATQPKDDVCGEQRRPALWSNIRLRRKRCSRGTDEES